MLCQIFLTLLNQDSIVCLACGTINVAKTHFGIFTYLSHKKGIDFNIYFINPSQSHV